MSDDAFDVLVIGAGPGGYVAAIRAAQLGLKTACIDKRGAFGGTCLNVGCIPSKALLHASEEYHKTAHVNEKLGIKAEGVALDLDAMMAYKSETVKGLTDGIKFLMKKNKIEAIDGAARLVGDGKIEVDLLEGGDRTISAKHIIIATGSSPASLPGIEIDNKRIVDSTGALSLPKVPKHLVVIGAGYIGLEMGSVWARLGAKVTVVEFLDRITPGMDGEISKEFQKVLQKQGFDFKLGTKVTGVEAKKTSASVMVEPAAGGDAEEIKCDYVLVSIGRVPHTDGLGLEDVGVALDDKGRIKTDGHFKTNMDGIYAIGDVIDGPMLAHKAEEEGVACAEFIAGKAGHVDYGVIPGVVYTSPEVASVGVTEEQLKDEGVDYTVGKFPFMGNAKAKVALHPEGFVKILADSKTDRVLGVHILGDDAGNLIAECALAMAFDASAEDIALTCHAHPTHAEAVKEAALAVAGRALHI